ncbi:MAG: hypothetical protein KGO50_02225 [Myxococcales bacterium]|nr:hypothetical protein [Myxococcales bacterium]
MGRRNETKLLRAFASSFRHWRRYHDLTVQQLSVADPSLGYERLQRLERGLELPDHATLMRLCQVLELVPEQLLPPGVLPSDLDELAPPADPTTDPLLRLHQADELSAVGDAGVSQDPDRVSDSPESEELNPLMDPTRPTERHILAMQRAHQALEYIGARLSERGAEALDLVLREVVSLFEPAEADRATEPRFRGRKRQV